MPKYTLLELVQDILSDMDSDEVNSISDTVESLQVAQIVRDVYFNIIQTKLFPTSKKLFSLTPYSDQTKPTHFHIPNNVYRIDWIKYDVRDSRTGKKSFSEITYLEPTEFVDTVYLRDSNESNIQVVTENGIELFIKNDSAPSYWTSFDDNTIIFDSFDSSLDNTLQESKLVAYGEVEPKWEMTNDFVPELPTRAFPYLLSEAKSVCFIKIKQEGSEKDELESRRQRARLARVKQKTGSDIYFPNYGRK